MGNLLFYDLLQTTKYEEHQEERGMGRVGVDNSNPSRQVAIAHPRFIDFLIKLFIAKQVEYRWHN